MITQIDLEAGGQRSNSTLVITKDSQAMINLKGVLTFRCPIGAIVKEMKGLFSTMTPHNIDARV